MDQTTAALVGAAIGASVTLVGTLLTLWIATRNEDRRWLRERAARDQTDRRPAYAKMLRTASVWREAAVDLEGEPAEGDWTAYWDARHDALEAGAELELIGSPLAVETMGEALDQLLDLWWDYEVNGPDMVQSSALWARMGYIDRHLYAFRDLARAEFGVDPLVNETVTGEATDRVRVALQTLREQGDKRRRRHDRG